MPNLDEEWYGAPTTSTLPPVKSNLDDEWYGSAPSIATAEQAPEELRRQIRSTIEPRWYDYPIEAVESVRRGAERTAGMAVEGVADIVELGTEAIGAVDPGLSGVLPAIRGAGQFLQRRAERLEVTPGFEDSWTRAIGEGVGSTAPAAIAGLAGGPAALAAFGTATGYESGYQQAKSLGAEEDDAKLWGLLSGAVTGVTETTLGAVPRMLGMAKKMDAVTGGWLKETLKSAAGEALQEALQEVPDEVARQAYINDRSFIEGLASVGTAATVGGAAGSLLGGLASAIKAKAEAELAASVDPNAKPNTKDYYPSKAAFDRWGIKASNRAERRAIAMRFHQQKESANAVKERSVEQGGVVERAEAAPRGLPAETGRGDLTQEGGESAKSKVPSILKRRFNSSPTEKENETAEQWGWRPKGAPEYVLEQFTADERARYESARSLSPDEKKAARKKSLSEQWRAKDARDQELEAGIPKALEEIDERLSTVGWKLDTESEAGSRYYRKGQRSIRVSDHDANEATAQWMDRNAVDSIRVDRRTWRSSLESVLERTQEGGKGPQVITQEPINASTGANVVSPNVTQAVEQVIEQGQATQTPPGQAQKEGAAVLENPLVALQVEAETRRDFPAAAQVQAEATIPPEAAMFAAGPIPPFATPPSEPITKADYFPNKKVAKRFDRMRTVPVESIGEKLRRWATKLGHITVRPNEHIPRGTERFASAEEFFRLRKDVAKSRTDEVTRTLAAITAPLNPKQYQVMTDLLLMRDLRRGVMDGLPMRMGFESLGDLEASIAKAEAIAANEPAIQLALDGRKKVVNELVGELVREKVLPADTKPDDYFHREVRKFMEADAYAKRATRGTKSPQERKAGFQKARKKGDLSGEQYDYIADYLFSEFRWMVDAHTKLASKRLWREFIEGPYDVSEQVRAEAKEAGDADWKKHLPEGHAIYQLRPGNPLFRAYSIDDQLAEQILEDGLGAIEADDLKQVTVMGGPFKQYVLPTEIVLELKKLEAEARKQSHPIDKFVVDAQNAWKVWTLLNPKTAPQYFLRNLSGDADVMVAGLPSAIGKAGGATAELFDYYIRKQPGMSDNLRRARDLGVMDAGMTVQEIPDLADLSVFKRFYENRFSPIGFGPKAVKRYFDSVKKWNSFRESILRYSTYLKYLDALKNDNLSTFGAANERIVRVLQKRHGNEVAAAHMARRLLGDYGNLSVLSKWLSSHLIPFWSYQHTLAERYPRLVINAAKAGGWRKATPAAALAALKVMTASRLARMYAAALVWNKLLFPDLEDDLGEYDQANPHIVTGRNPDGSVRLLRNFGAFGEFLEWFGMNTLLANWKKVEDGKWTVGEIINEMMFDPANKLVQGVRPDLKTGGEVAFGRTLFPDVRNPRAVEDRGELLASILNLRDEYRWAKGKVLEQGDRARPHYLQRWVTGVVDPRPNALIETYSLIDRFIKKEGSPRPDFVGDPHFRNMRRAAESNDREAFLEARGAYRKSGKTYRNFKASMQYLNPLRSLSGPMKQKFFEHLTPRQRDRVRVAMDYAEDVGNTMAVWWGSTP